MIVLNETDQLWTTRVIEQAAADAPGTPLGSDIVSPLCCWYVLICCCWLGCS